MNPSSSLAPVISSGSLSVYVAPGVAQVNGTTTSIPGTTVALAANSTNYVYVNTASGTIQTSTLGFPGPSALPIGIAITGTSSVVSLTDSRPDFVAGAGALLNYQSHAGGITGNSAAQTVFSYTLPANTLGDNKGIRLTAVWSHSTGSASVSYQWNFGSVAVISFSSTAAGQLISTLLVFNNGSTGAQDVSQLAFSNSGVVANSGQVTTGSVDTTQGVLVTFAFTVASTDAVAPKVF